MKKMIVMLTIVSSGLIHSSENLSQDRNSSPLQIREVVSEPNLPSLQNFRYPKDPAEEGSSTTEQKFPDVPMLKSRVSSFVDPTEAQPASPNDLQHNSAGCFSQTGSQGELNHPLRKVEGVSSMHRLVVNAENNNIPLNDEQVSQK